MYLLIICGQWVRLKIYSKLIASIICQNLLFGYLPNVDTSLNGHLLSTARYGTYSISVATRSEGCLACFMTFSTGAPDRS